MSLSYEIAIASQLPSSIRVLFFPLMKDIFSSADSESQNPFYFVSPRNIFSIARLLGKGKDAEVAIWHGLGCLPPRTKVQMDGNFYFKKIKKKSSEKEAKQLSAGHRVQ